jgi:hypothetical protein|tara:strand:- start:138 stop:356 length:219 start_codon:yes stop_codon:yes gene_type:complete
MTKWHYQLMKHSEDLYAVHEYYKGPDDAAWTESASSIEGESVEDVKQMLKMMLHDITRHGVKDYDPKEKRND